MVTWVRFGWVAFVAAALAGGSALAQKPTRGLTPVPSNDASPAKLDVSVDPKELRIGSPASVCFQSSRSGFVSLWNISTDNKVSLIFPNQFANVGPSAMIQANQRYCAGASGDAFRFRVDGPAGTEDVYLLWTTRAELQPSGRNYADAPALVADLQRLGGAGSTEWDTKKVTYDIVPAAGAVAPPLPPQQVTGNVSAPPPGPSGSTGQTPPLPPANGTASNAPSGAPDSQIWILSMGANVGKLTKANQDANQFTKATTELFNVPANHIRLLENGKKADFVRGMNWLTENAQPSDFVFIYFSGHGGRFKSETSDDGWDEFLVPYDFEAPEPDPKNLLFSQQFAFLINRLQTKHVVAVVDACNSAGVFRSLDAGVLGARSKFYALTDDLNAGAIRAAAEERAAEAPPRTRAAGGRNRIKANGLLLAAAHRDQSALESSIGGFFTVAIVEEMRSKAGGNLNDVFERTIARTEQLSKNRQQPEAVGDPEVGKTISFDP